MTHLRPCEVKKKSKNDEKEAWERWEHISGPGKSKGELKNKTRAQELKRIIKNDEKREKKKTKARDASRALGKKTKTKKKKSLGYLQPPVWELGYQAQGMRLASFGPILVIATLQTLLVMSKHRLNLKFIS